MANLDIGIQVNNTGAIHSLQQVDNAIVDVGQEAVATSKKTNKAFVAMEKGFKGVQTAAKTTATAVKSIGSALSGPAGIIAGLVTGGGAMAMFASSIGNGSALYALNKATGISIKSLEQFRTMISLTGGSIDDLKDGIQTFSERMGEAAKDTQSEWATRFKAMGISVTGSVDDAMNQMLRSLAKMVDGGQRTQAWWIGNDIFGGAWEKMSTMVTSGTAGFERAMQRVQGATVFDERKVLQMQAFNEEISKLKNSLIGFGVEISSKVLPILEGLAGGVLKLVGINLSDLQGSGERVGNAFVKGFKSVFTGLFGSGGIASKISTAFFTLKGIFLKLGEVVKAIFDPKRSTQAIDYLASTFKNKMLEAFKVIKDELGNLLAGSENSIASSMGRALLGVGKESKAQFKQYYDIAVKGMGGVSGLSATGSGLLDEIEKAKAKIIKDRGRGASSSDEYKKLYDAEKKIKALMLENKGTDALQQSINAENQRLRILKDQLGVAVKFDEITANTAQETAKANASIGGFYSNVMGGITSANNPYEGLSKDKAKPFLNTTLMSPELSLNKGSWEKSIDRVLPSMKQSFNDKMAWSSSVMVTQLMGGQTGEGRLSIADQLFGKKGERLGSIISAGQEIASQTQNIMGSIFDIKQNARDKEIKAQEDARRAEIDGMNISDRRKQKLYKQAEAEAEKLRKASFEKKKKYDIAQALINGASGVAGAWASAMQLPFPANIIEGAAMSALLTGVTVAQVASIKSQNFANGGIVSGDSFSGDRVQANVNSGEMILNQNQMSTLFNKIDTNNLGGQAGVFSPTLNTGDIIIQGNADQTTIETIKQIKDKQTQEIKKAMYNLYVNNELDFLKRGR